MQNKNIAIIGLGYVGLPLAVEFGKKRNVIGFDIDHKRVKDLQNGIDKSREVSSEDLKRAKNSLFTHNLCDIKDCSIFIVTVQTPVHIDKGPNLTPLITASEMIGSILKSGDLVIYESTVYPGATEEVCVPALEKSSGLIFNKDFYCGYSPERINPGDKDRHVSTIMKVTSGSTEAIAKEVDNLYKEIITAGTYLAESIKVAEASKVIENTQRDLNIALINELSIIFNKLNIDTESVLNAAGTKWNFLPFRPGLVGGHCIGVDPYYLIHKSKEVGYTPELILSGRKINEQMGKYLTDRVVDLMKVKNILVEGANILIMGFTFKENCPDIRNTRVIDVYNNFRDLNCDVDIYDPWVDALEVKQEYDIDVVSTPEKNKYDAILMAVAHDEFKKYSPINIKMFAKKSYVLFDVKYLFSKDKADGRL
ncbi:MAG: Vi polysaccharide biosynthesis UDP-N-acetylglucosamine C-6 dehydrogenase TviB [Methylophilales bacterium]|nr:Vi polysaccharide biosynthesis UDP-N-acetylglucosamine C-6 dehydrogenase TviB [Methylophilales bacterium]